MPRLTRAEVEELLATSFRLVLPHADLTDADLSHLDLRRADLSHSTMIRTRLFYSRLDGANLSHADLSSARLPYASLRSAVLRSAQLEGASFKGADLRGADLRGAAMRRTDFVAAQVEGARIDKVDVDAEAVGFGEPTRTIGVRFRDSVPQPTSRGPLTEIPDLEELGITGFDGIPEIIRLVVAPDDMTTEWIAASAMINLGPRLLVAGGLPTLLDAIRDGSRSAVDWLSSCGEEARPALAPLITMLSDRDVNRRRKLPPQQNLWVPSGSGKFPSA
jgi:hypothetical protein